MKFCLIKNSFEVLASPNIDMMTCLILEQNIAVITVQINKLIYLVWRIGL